MRERLEATLRSFEHAAVAVSGGVDSMTLATLANRLLGRTRVAMIHAVSPAVPPEASERVRRFADSEGWDLIVLDAGETKDPRYVSNPVNRCYFCKTHLYDAISDLSDRPILSGANTDDLGEYRPGLDAARERRVAIPTSRRAPTSGRCASWLATSDSATSRNCPPRPAFRAGSKLRSRSILKLLRACMPSRRWSRGAWTPRPCVAGCGAPPLSSNSTRKALLPPIRMPNDDLIQAMATLMPARLSHLPVRFEVYRNGSAFVGKNSVRSDVVFDFGRRGRIGVDEAVLCEGKTVSQIAAILEDAEARGVGLLLTRCEAAQIDGLPNALGDTIDYCPLSRTAFFGPLRPVAVTGKVAVVAAGTSDAGVAREALRTLRHAGVEGSLIVDVGVAGLWRLMDRIDDIRRHPIVIAVAGMDAALASVIGGLASGVVIGVPTSVGYGAAESGRTALNAMLASCAPGIAVCNIDNGYGAASCALRILNAMADGDLSEARSER